MTRRTIGSVALLACVCATGCEEAPKATQDKPGADAGSEAPVLDRNIEKAVASAAAMPAGSAAAVDGPPPNGVFGPGEADKAHPPGAPPKVELLSEGSEPRISLTPKLGGKPARLRLQIGRRSAQQAYPNIDYTLALEIGDGEAKDQNAKADTEEAPPPSGPQPAALVVKKAALSAEQPGQLPKGLGDELAKMEGSRLSGTLAPDGSMSGLRIEPGKKADVGLAGVLEALRDAASFVLAPMPDKPVGAGGYWMATDRLDSGGIEVVRYRVTRVEKVSGDEALLSVQIRQYVAKPDQLPVGAPQGFTLAGYDTQGAAELTRSAGALVPSMGKITVPVTLQLMAAQVQRVLPLQTLTEARILPEPVASAKP